MKKKILLIFVTICCAMCFLISCTNSEKSVELAKPTPAQAAWQDMELGMFIHFGIETWQDKETDDEPVKVSKIRLRVLDSKMSPILRKLAAYNCSSNLYLN